MSDFQEAYHPDGPQYIRCDSHLANRIPKEHVGEMLGYSSDYMLRHYTQALERNSQKA